MALHFAGQNDCLTSLAATEGFAGLSEIYNHPDNSVLKQKRDNPDVLCARDKIRIPELRLQRLPVATESRHRFRRKLPIARLRLQLLDEDAGPLADLQFKLTLVGAVREGVTDSDGRLDVDVPPTEERALLQLWTGNGQPAEWDIQLGRLQPVEAISGLQARLTNLGIDVGAIDGVPGPMTAEGVRLFQTENDLLVDGVSGPKTQTALKRVYGC